MWNLAFFSRGVTIAYFVVLLYNYKVRCILLWLDHDAVGQLPDDTARTMTRVVSFLPPIQTSAYGTWVSEVMLQQTRVETVVEYYAKWMALFPTPKALADADLEQVCNLFITLTKLLILILYCILIL